MTTATLDALAALVEQGDAALAGDHLVEQAVACHARRRRHHHDTAT